MAEVEIYVRVEESAGGFEFDIEVREMGPGRHCLLTDRFFDSVLESGVGHIHATCKRFSDLDLIIRPATNQKSIEVARILRRRIRPIAGGGLVQFEDIPNAVIIRAQELSVELTGERQDLFVGKGLWFLSCVLHCKIAAFHEF